MASPGRRLTAGFFNPQPRRANSDPTRPDLLSVYSDRCQEWSCRMRISVYCSGRLENAVEEEEPRRKLKLSPRRVRKTSYTLPRHSSGDHAPLLPALHRGQTRHASHSSEPPFRESDPPSSSSDASALQPPEASVASDPDSIQTSDSPPEELEPSPPPEELDVSTLEPPAASEPEPTQTSDSPPEPSPPPEELDLLAETLNPPLLDNISETDSPPSQVVDAPETPPHPKPRLEDVRYLQLLLAENDQSVQLERLWHAYETVQIHGGLAALTSEELVTLAETLLVAAEKRAKLDELPELHKWGDRIRCILDSVPPTTVPPESLRLVRACAVALEGDIQQAFDLLHSDLQHHDQSHAHLRVFETERYGRSLELAAAGASLRTTAFSIATGLSLPATVIADKEKEWSKVQREQLGNFLTEAFFRAKYSSESVHILREMRRQGLAPAPHLPLQLVRALARDNLFDEAHTLYASLEPDGSYQYLFTGLYLYAHEGQEAPAIQYFDRISEAGWRNHKVILEMMYAHAVKGQTEQTLAVFRRFYPDDEHGVPQNYPIIEQFTVGIFAHAQRGDYTGITPWVAAMAKVGIEPDTHVFSTILKSFALRGDLKSIASVLDQMRANGTPPNLVTYSTVMTLLAHRQDPASTEAIYKRALADGIVPDGRMVGILMNAHIAAGSWKGVIRAFDYVRTLPHMKLTISLYNLLIKAYLHIGAPFRMVSRVFNQLERLRVRPDAYTFTLLIQSACNARLMNVATTIFTEMERLAEQWGSRRHITIWTLTTIMAGFLRLGDRERAMEVYQDILERGLEPTALTYSLVISAYASPRDEESIKLAEDFIQQLNDTPPQDRTWDVPSYGRHSAADHLYLPLMHAYSSHGVPEEVERILQEMLEAGGEPTLSNLGMVLDAYASVHDVDNVRRIWSQLFNIGLKYTTIPLFPDESEEQRSSKMHSFILCIPLSTYIHTLSLAGLNNEIAEVWKTFRAAGLSFSADNWNELAHALIRAGELERCLEVLQKVLLPYFRRSNRLRNQRDPQPPTPYSLDVEPEDRRPLERPLVGKALSAATKESRSLRRMAGHLERVDQAADLADHLHVLHRVSPMWNTWAPRQSTLRLLFEAVLRLRAGFPADTPKRGFTEEKLDFDEAQARVEDARQRLRNMYQTYPDAVRALSDFELDERARLGRWYQTVYPWADRAARR
ncbi:hypothetical protein C8R46DRAFT_1218424 [Mycena filopes]|nr:hypothetical protein C8R46DRAFT_1218424 [Mycena filopes]